MKITLLGNIELPYSSETYYVKTLTEMGHQVTALHETKAKGEEVEELASQADLFVWIHGHSDDTPGKPMAEVLDSLKTPSVTYHHDLFKGLDREDVLKSPVYQKIDHLFSTDRLMAEEMGGHYLPSAVYGREALMFKKSSSSVPEVVFLGSKGYHSQWPYRPQLIDWLDNTYGGRFGWYSGEPGSLGLKRGADMNQLFADTKVVVGDTLCPNFNYPYYWSDRLWETLGRGGFLIMPYVKGMDRYIKDGQHLVFYNFGDFDDLKKKIDYYLEHDFERKQIQRNGWYEVSTKHTYIQRWEEIFNVIGKN